LIEDADFPWEVIRLNSEVIIRDKIVRLNYAYTVVMPELADHKQCKVSVFSAIGSALFGNSRGNDIYWKVPNGKRYFTIMAVSQYAFLKKDYQRSKSN
jgi:transcription elongation GreA/GreB family factor